ncbi:MAG: HAMP domain-containing histidine kinase [Chloroflexi bacterium]|nr:HAMP domain-containing histidine kinase [Chloroflexota bacterium]
MFHSLRSRLIASFAVIVIITLLTAGLALTARLGGYRDQLTASTLRSVAAPVYYNLTFFPNNESPAQRNGQRLRAELVQYLRAQAQDAGVIVLLIDAEGAVISDQQVSPDLAGQRFDVPPPPQKGPNFAQLPEGRTQLPNGDNLVFVTVPMPKAVRAQAAGVAAIVVALPQTDGRDVFRDLFPRLLFAGGVGLGVALVGALVLWWWMYRPLGKVTGGIRAVANGQFGERVPVTGPTEMRALAMDVNSMADSVQLSQRALRDFLANVSHELKTPLTSIRGFSQALLDGTLDTPDERARAARVIDAESRRLLHLVGELLDLSRIESGQQAMNLAPVRVSELLSHVRDVFSIRSGESGIGLSILGGDREVTVAADFDRVEQVLGNLLDNAFRHAERGGQVEVGVRRAAAGFAELYVTNTGAPVPPDELARVFERFYRATGERPGSGAGLGLTISREIVHAHGGRIWAESMPQATRFAFTLPLDASSEAAPDVRSERRGDAARRPQPNV